MFLVGESLECCYTCDMVGHELRRRLGGSHSDTQPLRGTSGDDPEFSAYLKAAYIKYKNRISSSHHESLETVKGEFIISGNTIQL